MPGIDRIGQSNNITISQLFLLLHATIYQIALPSQTRRRDRRRQDTQETLLQTARSATLQLHLRPVFWNTWRNLQQKTQHRLVLLSLYPSRHSRPMLWGSHPLLQLENEDPATQKNGGEYCRFYSEVWGEMMLYYKFKRRLALSHLYIRYHEQKIKINSRLITGSSGALSS